MIGSLIPVGLSRYFVRLEVFDQGRGLALWQRTVCGSLVHEDRSLETHHLFRMKRPGMVSNNCIYVRRSGTEQQSESTAVTKSDNTKTVQSREWKLTVLSDKRLTSQIVDA